MKQAHSKELDVFKHALHKAGQFLLQHRHKRMAEQYVREVEAASTAIIMRQITSAFPEYGIQNRYRENESTRPGHPYVIFFDPLNDLDLYREGELFTVHAALMEHRHGMLNPVVAAIYDPSAQELYTAVKGEGAFMHDRTGRKSSISVRAVDDIDLIIRHRPENKELQDIIERLAKGVGPQYMQSLLKIVTVAYGGATVYACPTSVPIHLTDIAAPHLILEEAGGRITTLAGRPFVYDQKALVNRQGILATNGIVHQRVIDDLNR